MGNILKGILYTGLAGAVGVGGYLLGKYKHMGGKVSLTMIGLAFVLYAPKGCDVLETYVKTRGEVEKAKIYGTAYRDSIDAAVDSERSRDSIIYLKQFLNNVTSIDEKLEDTYNQILSDNEKRYNRLLQQNTTQYNDVLNGVMEQNELLKKDLEKMKITTSNNTSNKSNTRSYNWSDGKVVNTKIVNDGFIEDRILPDGTKTVVVYTDKRVR